MELDEAQLLAARHATGCHSIHCEVGDQTRVITIKENGMDHSNNLIILNSFVRTTLYSKEVTVSLFTITTEILVHSVANFYCQQAYRHMNL